MRVTEWLLLLAVVPAMVGQAPCPEPRPLALWVGRDLALTGFTCVQGEAHANGSASALSLNDPGYCPGFEGTVTSGDGFPPPPLRVDPDAFPGCTYYFVVPVGGGFPVYCLILGRDGVTQLQTARGDSLQSVLSQTAEGWELSFSSSDLDRYFGSTSNVFPKDPGDRGVVVNFARGQEPVDLVLQSKPGHTVEATFINVRFTGSDTDDHRDPALWSGGRVDLRSNCTFAPACGLALVARELGKSGAVGVVGTADAPGLCYVTGNLGDLNQDIDFRGSVIVLGGATGIVGLAGFTFDPRFYDRLPEPVQAAFQGTCWKLDDVAAVPVTWGRLKRRAEGF